MQRIGAAFRASLGSSGVTAVLPTDIGEVRRLGKGQRETGHEQLVHWHGWYCEGLEFRLRCLARACPRVRMRIKDLAHAVDLTDDQERLPDACRSYALLK